VIFQAALKALKTPAAQTVFIDDIQAYVQAAQALGLQAIHFRDATQLRSELKALEPSLSL
jgi:FMN phosphatase YigB (HAD superfamily)